MSTVPSFSMKLIRADEHLKALNDQVIAFLQIHPYKIVTEKNVPPGYITWKIVYQHAVPDQLLMLIGDVIHNLRSSLDHLAWRLAGKDANSLTEFPIFIDAKKFSGTGNGRSGVQKMHDMPTPAKDIIESLQPYHGRNGQPEMEPLWLLQKLSIEDKHHTLNLVAGALNLQLDVRVRPDLHPSYGLTGQTGWRTFKDGAEINRTFFPAYTSKMEDYSYPAFDIALDPEGPGRGIPLLNALRDMREAVAEAITLLTPHIP